MLYLIEVVHRIPTVVKTHREPRKNHEEASQRCGYRDGAARAPVKPSPHRTIGRGEHPGPDLQDVYRIPSSATCRKLHGSLRRPQGLRTNWIASPDARSLSAPANLLSRNAAVCTQTAR
jgi:hypothetical protein